MKDAVSPNGGGFCLDVDNVGAWAPNIRPLLSGRPGFSGSSGKGGMSLPKGAARSMLQDPPSEALDESQWLKPEDGKTGTPTRGSPARCYETTLSNFHRRRRSSCSSHAHTLKPRFRLLASDGNVLNTCTDEEGTGIAIGSWRHLGTDYHDFMEKCRSA